ncbi:hypothetical protein [Streptomyces chartreusis]
MTGTGPHSINGITLRPDGTLVAASLIGETLTEIDPATGTGRPLARAPRGRSDDVVVSPEGEVLWTDPRAGAVKARAADGTVRTVADGLPGVNSIAYDRSTTRLFVGQTFLGDALWEIDPARVTPKRLVAKDIGQPNAFAFGPDGQIYAPVSKRKAVIRVDPATGAVEKVVDGFTQPVSVRFDSRDRLHVLDGARGEVIRVDAKTGAKRTVATLPAAADNMIIGPDDHMYISNMADSSVLDVDLDSGDRRVVTSSPLAFPVDIAAGPDDVVIADSTAVRSIDTADGQLHELARRLATKIQFPTGVSVHGDRLVLVSELIGTVQILDRTGHPIRHAQGLQRPSDAVELDDGGLIAAEPAAGRLVRIDGAAPPRPLAVKLGTPTGLTVADDGRILVADASGGRLLAVDPKQGTVTAIATGLGAPRSVGTAPDGAVVVLDAGGRVLRLPSGATRATVLAEGLAVGYLDGPYPRSGGVAVTAAGSIYVTADKENSLYVIRRK